MTPEAQRIAIAEACGWTQYPDEPKKAYTPSGASCYWDDAPDYLNDLNAMHEAEKALGGKYGLYESLLGRVVARDWPGLDSPCLLVAPWHATAAQRAEAFLLALDLFK